MKTQRATTEAASRKGTRAVACFVFGIGAALLGSVLTVVAWVQGAEAHPWLRGVGTACLVLIIPLLILAGFYLDDMEQADGAEKQRKSQRGSVFVSLLSVMSLCLGFLLLAPVELRAQQTTFDVPSTDARDRCKDHAEPDITVKPNNAITATDSSLSSSGTAPQPLVEDESKVPSEEGSTSPSQPQWQYGGFIDLGYLLDFNHPENQLFRSRGTAFRVDSVFLNMAAFYVKRKVTEQSRWGVELTAQAGKDAEFFGFSATAPNIGGYKFLRQLGPTNVSYLAPVGKGLTLQAGIFTSLIGYDSLYAKDNFNYTRPWGADFTPYFMMGANASHAFNEKVTGTLFVVNGYWHLARANNVPSSGGQIAYKLNPRVTVRETVLFGPHQSNKSFKFWRFLTDTIVERKTDPITLAFEYIYSQERVDTLGNPRALMMSSQLPVRWALNKRWALAVRPEVFWDRDGRWTLARQTVKAFTTTLEYRLPYRQTNTIFRLEHRFDDSRGRDGGFFRGREVQPGVVGLTPSQHLLIFATMFTFDR